MIADQSQGDNNAIENNHNSKELHLATKTKQVLDKEWVTMLLLLML